MCRSSLLLSGALIFHRFSGDELERRVCQSPDATIIQRVALLRCGSMTHSIDLDQRYVGIAVVGRDESTLTCTAPSDGAVAPPGYYMLFLVDRAGRPCEYARFLRVESLPEEDPVQVPEVLDLNQPRARRVIEEAGLVPRFVGAVNADPSYVIKQRPSAGEDVPRGSTVMCYLKAGTPP